MVGRWKGAWPCLFLGFLVFAGCANAPSARPDSAGDAMGLSVQGIVVDTAIRPLAGVTVRLDPGGLNQTTLANGQFTITGLQASEYTLSASKDGYLAVRTTVHVDATTARSPIKLTLDPEAGSVKFANLYKYKGFFECGTNAVRICANVNILTTIVLCHDTGGQVCLGNVTQDRSLLFQAVAPGLSFLQAELVWTPSSTTGASMTLLTGGGTEEELKAGVNLPAYNLTSGASPLLARITNHEGPNSWCGGQAACPKPDTLNQSTIGSKRALLVQVDAGPTFLVDPLCSVGASPCGAGVSFQQDFQLFTTTFYNYEPPADWLFANTGEVPPPPS
jgi:hypothetical protein